MRSYAQYCPIAKASEILGDRWTLLIVREMLGGASGFNELQRGLPGISRSVLTDRLRALERAEIIERRTGPKGRTLEYRLTPAGRDLEAVVQAIGEWGVTWSFTDPRPEELDPDLLIVWMARHVDHDELPADRTVVQFDFRHPAKRYWMVLEPSDVSVCLQHPGFDVDLEVNGRHRHPLPRLPGTGRARRRDAGRQADDHGPASAAAGVRSLVRLERVRPSEPLGRRAPQGGVPPSGPHQGEDRRVSEGGAVRVAAIQATPVIVEAEATIRVGLHLRKHRDGASRARTDDLLIAKRGGTRSREAALCRSIKRNLSDALGTKPTLPLRRKQMSEKGTDPAERASSNPGVYRVVAEEHAPPAMAAANVSHPRGCQSADWRAPGKRVPPAT